jgi:hypothetical protein
MCLCKIKCNNDFQNIKNSYTYNYTDYKTTFDILSIFWDTNIIYNSYILIQLVVIHKQSIQYNNLHTCIITYFYDKLIGKVKVKNFWWRIWCHTSFNEKFAS